MAPGGWVGDESFPVEKERYVLYVAAGCPTCATAWLAAAWLALDTNRSLEVVRAFPAASEGGFFFEASTAEERALVAAHPDVPFDTDPVFGAADVRSLYDHASPPGFSGACTLPVLIDRKARRMVSTDPPAIAEMVATRFSRVMMYSLKSCDLVPEGLGDAVRAEVLTWGEALLAKVTAAEATSDQVEFGTLEAEILSALEDLDARFKRRKFLLGKQFTLADLAVWPMLLYLELGRGAIGLQRRSLRAHFPHVWSFVQEVYKMPGIRRATDLGGVLLHAHLGHRQRGRTVPALEDGFQEQLTGIPHRKNTLLARVLREAQHGMWVVPVIIGFFIGSEMGHKSQEQKLRREGRLIDPPKTEEGVEKAKEAAGAEESPTGQGGASGGGGGAGQAGQ